MFNGRFCVRLRRFAGGTKWNAMAVGELQPWSLKNADGLDNYAVDGIIDVVIDRVVIEIRLNINANIMLLILHMTTEILYAM